MGKVKLKKQDIWIDMTPMSDVMVLLLCFFMLTSTFTKPEPVKVVEPQSVSEIKVPEKDVLNILVDKEGKVFMNMDNQIQLGDVVLAVTDQFGIGLTGTQLANFKSDPMFGTPMNNIEKFLNMEESQRRESLKEMGIPLDSIDGGKSEFQMWVKEARNVNSDIKVAIKADKDTPYKTIKRVMNELQDINENRYFLITSLKTQED
ncbi:MAG: biopolymer transporter ExbD [Prevotellaceae bacterium]|nr:biopolymer transporter ExbD [Prevotellaceae bacterium]MDO4991879.1 biopolymer transporter ExbD [Prevotellaceae bacterium]